MAACLGDATIAAYVDGALDPDEIARVDGHIDQCATCRTQLSDVAAVPHSFTDATLPAPPIGRAGEAVPEVVLGRYELGAVIGRGAMGVVARARDPELERDIAIKLVQPGHRHGAWRARMRAEARAMAKLRHPNVVTVYDAGTVGEQIFVAMELVAGESLRLRLARDRSDALGLCIQAGRGLCAAHTAGIVHGDIKPDNILVDRDGRALVGDFGLARAVADPGEGGLVGTPAYMAPELLRHEPATPATDQYALAVTTYEAISGARPRAAESLDELRAAAAAPIARPKPMSRRVWRVVARGLAPDPGERYPSLAAFVAALERAGRSRSPWLIAVPAVALAAIAVLVFGMRDRETCSDPVEHAKDFALTQPCTTAACTALATELAGRATEWRTSHVGVCSATRDGQQSAELLDRRMGCLDQRRLEHHAVVARLGEQPLTDDAAVAGLAAVQRLARPATCRGSDALSFAPTVADPAAELEARGWLAAARADIVLLHPRHGLDELAPHIDAIRALGDLPLLARAYTVLGQLQHDVGQVDAAERSLQLGLQAAASAGDDVANATLLLRLVFLVGNTRQHWDRAAELLRSAELAVIRAGNPPDLRAELMLHRGYVAGGQGDHAKAIHEYADLVAYRRTEGDQLGLISALRMQCRAENAAGDPAAAKQHCDEALAIGGKTAGVSQQLLATLEMELAALIARHGELPAARRLWESALVRLEHGAERGYLFELLVNLGSVTLDLHDVTAATGYVARARSVLAAIDAADAAVDLDVRLRVRLANQLYRLGDADAAIHLAEDIARRAETTFGLAHPGSALALETLGGLYLQTSRMTEARDVLERASAAARAAYGERSRDTLRVEGIYGMALEAAGDAKAAHAIFERVLLALEATVPADAPELAEGYLNVADTSILLGDPQRAVELAGKALAIRERDPGQPIQIAEVRFTLGKAMWGVHHDAAAVAVVRKSRDEMVKIGPAAAMLPEVESWLAGKR